jgi:hypothetical protein
MLPADIIATLDWIEPSLSDAFVRLSQAAEGVRSRIRSEMHHWRGEPALPFLGDAADVGVRSGSGDPLEEAERHIGHLVMALKSVRGETPAHGGRKEERSVSLARDVRNAIFRAGMRPGPIWREALSIVIAAAELPFDAERAIATFKRGERRKRTNQTNKRGT